MELAISVGIGVSLSYYVGIDFKAVVLGLEVLLNVFLGFLCLRFLSLEIAISTYFGAKSMPQRELHFEDNTKNKVEN